MKPINTTPTALLLIDIQRGFDHPTHWGTPRNNPHFEANVSSLLTSFRTVAATTTTTDPPSPKPLVIHIHHHSNQPTSQLHPSATFPDPANPTATIRGIDPQAYATPAGSEPVFTKSVNSSFVGTKLEAYLRENGIRQLVVVGLTTDHCVSTTVRMAANLKVLGDEGGVDGSGPGAGDHGVLLVGDATATYGKGSFEAETVHDVHLRSLDGEFCRVVRTEDVLREVLGVVPLS